MRLENERACQGVVHIGSFTEGGFILHDNLPNKPATQEFAYNAGMGESINESSSSKEFWLGIKAELPILVGVLPFGMIYGISALSAGLTPVAGMAVFWLLELFFHLAP